MGAASLSPLIVSLHMPKTAGTSFRDALVAAHGDALLLDYAGLPMQHGRGTRQLMAVGDGLRLRLAGLPDGIRCVHGHFLPVKYRIALGRRARFVTWMRHPVDRLVSHYRYWKREGGVRVEGQPLRRRVVDENWSLERFCLGPELRDVYARYLWACGPAHFAFIGICERYPQELQRFGSVFGIPAELPVAHKLRNPDHARRELTQRLRMAIEQYHARDMALYHWARRQAG